MSWTHTESKPFERDVNPTQLPVLTADEHPLDMSLDILDHRLLELGSALDIVCGG